MKADAICILKDGTSRCITVDLDYIEDSDDLYDQVEEELGRDRLSYIDNEDDILNGNIYDAAHAEEWMNNHPHGYYDDENHKSTGDEEEEEE